MGTPPKTLLYYLAHPYSSPIDDGERLNAINATHIAAKLLEAGYNVYSPLTHCHPINVIVKFSWEKWMEFDKMMMDRCDAIVLGKDWETSRGCKIERAHFEAMGKPIYIVDDLLTE